LTSVSNFPSTRALVDKYELRAARALGQNFLIDTNITNKIARTAAIKAGEHVIEVGPGPASLTRELMQTDAASITAIELDTRCLPLLQEFVDVSDGKLRIIHGDAMKIDIQFEVQTPRVIVANLPYNVATPLLIGWLKMIGEDSTSITRMTLMFQKEVAERICASPNTKNYGRLSIITQWLCDVEYNFDVPPTAFLPAPKVTSAIVTLTAREKPLYDADFATLEKVVAAAFNQRRKMLRQSLKALGGEALLEQADIDPTRRAETLSVEEFCTLARLL